MVGGPFGDLPFSAGGSMIWLALFFLSGLVSAWAVISGLRA